MSEYLTVANGLTLTRLLLALSLPFLSRDFAFIVAIVVVIGDVDGAVARWLNQVTRVGAMLDKLADVVFVTVSLVFFVVSDVTSAVLVAVLLGSRIGKLIAMRSRRKLTHAPVFTKAVYVALFVFILVSIRVPMSSSVLAIMTGLFVVEAVVSVVTERKASD